MGKLEMQYRPGAVWVMARETEAYLLGLTGNQFVLLQPPVSAFGAGLSTMFGYPVFATEDAATIAASAKSMLFGNFSLYGWVRNRSLRVRRLVELYAGNGQVGILANYRAGGEVLQSEAFQYATHPSA
jgi:HK97 family phage major capsid protein